jgi:hypothetical protein
MESNAHRAPSALAVLGVVLGWTCLSGILAAAWIMAFFGFGFGGGRIAEVGIVWTSLMSCLAEGAITAGAVSLLCRPAWARGLRKTAASLTALCALIFVAGFVWWTRQ